MRCMAVMADLYTLAHGLLFCLVAYYFGIYRGPSGPSVVKQVDQQYDYVIVGGGSAGCVLAARLSEDEGVTVLLLEAGGEETNNPTMDMPLAAFGNFFTPASASEYTIPQKSACLGMQGNQCYVPRGRGLGGGGSINCMEYVRGNKEDYDGWAEMGCDGWSYKDVLPYFIKLENTQIPEHRSSPYHGTEGPITIEKGGQTAVGPALVKAGEELGYKDNDHNGASQEGFSTGQWNRRNGARWAAAKAYLRPAMARTNLHVATNAFVTRVLFEKKRAVGVVFVRNDAKQSVKARKEVILSAGAIATPKLLMLSGVGPKEHLQSFKIPVVADLPVGENHQDHIMTDALSGIVDDGGAINGRTFTNWLENIKYHLFGTGKLTLGCGSDGVGFVRVPNQPQNKKTPFIEYMGLVKLMGTDPTEEHTYLRNFNYKQNVFKELHIGEETTGKDGFVLLSVITRPFSRGTVKLASTDPFEQAAIDVNYLSDTRDVDIMVDGIRIGQELLKTEALRKIGFKAVQRHHPGCKQHKYDSDDYWGCYVRHNSLTVYHSSGTCKMGAANDPSAVLDPNLRVRGLKGLRVVDTSIMPTVTAGNTNFPTMMIAEKAADIIRGKKTVKAMNI